MTLDKDIEEYGKFIGSIFGGDVKKIVSLIVKRLEDGQEEEHVLEMTFDDDEKTWRYVKRLVKDGRMK